jgi:hypothetical protein
LNRIKLGWRLLFHSLGLGCLSSAIFLQILVFRDIALKGYFLATEANQLILSFEVFLTIFSFIYFVYIYQRFIRSIK